MWYMQEKRITATNVCAYEGGGALMDFYKNRVSPPPQVL